MEGPTAPAWGRTLFGLTKQNGRQFLLPAVEPNHQTPSLPASSTVESTVETAASRCRAPCDSAAEVIRHGSASRVHRAACDGTSEARPTVVSRPNHRTRMAHEAVEPGPCADKDPAGEPPRAVVSNRRTRIRIVRIITVGADRRCRHNCGPDSHADAE